MMAYRRTTELVRDRLENYRVWFLLTERDGEYDVVMYFDNMVGQPKEEKQTPKVRNLVTV